MRDLMFDPTATDGQIRAKRQELRRMQDELEDVVIGDFLSLRSILTPEQRKKLPEIKPGAHEGGAPMAGQQFRGGFQRQGRFAGQPAGPPDSPPPLE